MARIISFCFSAAAFTAIMLWGFLHLPEFGKYPGPYGDILNAITVSERNVTNVPTAVNFDFRGFDTLGEELILFGSVAGLALLIRKEWSGKKHSSRENNDLHTSLAVRILGFFLAAPTVLFGFYVVLHGQLTPGGGFHGGVIIATGILLVFLTRGTEIYKFAAPQDTVEIIEGLAALAYILIGLAALFGGYAILYNFLPLGQVKGLASGGTIAALNIAVGFEVAAAFVLVFSEFIKEIFS